MSGPNIQLSPNHKLSNVDIVNRLTCPQMRNRPVVLKLDLKVLKCAPRLKMQCTGIVLYLQFCPKMQSAVLPCEASAVLATPPSPHCKVRAMLEGTLAPPLPPLVCHKNGNLDKFCLMSVQTARVPNIFAKLPVSLILCLSYSYFLEKERGSPYVITRLVR